MERGIRRSFRLGTPARCASFDVFDTVLLRRLILGSNVAQFALDIATRSGLLEPGFADAAIHDFERLAHDAGQRAVLTSEVWRTWCEHHALASTLGEKLTDLELQVESAFAEALPSGAEVVHAARASGCSVSFVSDTPWAEHHLAEVLQGIGIAGPDDRVFTSATRHHTKSSGRLFDIAIRELGCSPKEIRHVGDDPVGDVRRARSRGLRAEHMRSGRPTRWEHTLAVAGRDNRMTSALFAGAARLARLQRSDGSLPPAAARVSAGVAGPLLTAYVWWTIEQAIHLELDRLYFCGRDGELLLLLAQDIRYAVDPERKVELRYLAGSRRAWQFAALHCAEPKDVSWLLDGIDSVPTAFEALGIDCEAWTQKIHCLDDLLSAVSSDTELRDVIDKSASEAHRSMSSFLAQEGLLDGAPKGIVDVGWSGRAIRPLDAVIRSSGGAGRREYFFLGYRPAGRDPWNSPVPRAFVPGATSSAYLVEAFCASTAPSAWGYEQSDNGHVSIIEGPHEGDGLRLWGIDHHRSIVRAVASEFAKSVTIGRRLDDRWEPDVSSCAPVLSRALEELRRVPTAEEADAWGTFPVVDAHLGTPSMELAPKYGPHAVIAGTRRDPSRWSEASLVRSARPVRSGLNARFRAARILQGHRARFLRP